MDRPAVTWTEVRIATAPEAVDAVAALLTASGAGGVQIEESPGGALVRAHFRRLPAGLLDQIRGRLAFLEEFGVPIGPARIETAFVDEASWADAWKRHYHVMRIGRRLVVRPSWEPHEAGPDDVVITLDPGMAFGTGTHPTTAMCLRWLEERVQPGCRVADIGAGSGILAIAAALLGARVEAVDIDEDAVAIARRNAALNGAADRISVLPGSADALLRAGRPAFDLAVSNLTADPVVELAGEMLQLLKPEGWWMASGIIDSRAAEVGRRLEERGWSITRRWSEGEWVSLELRRPMR